MVKYRRNITLEPMNAYERHVIHETLQDYPDIITYSTGAEPNRRTVIAFSRGRRGRRPLQRHAAACTAHWFTMYVVRPAV